MHILRSVRNTILAMLCIAVPVVGAGVLPAAAQSPGPAASGSPGPVPSQAPTDRFMPMGPRPMPSDAELAADAALAFSDEPPALPASIDVMAVQHRAEAQARLMPGRDWAIGDLALALDYDPMAAFAFVRDSIGFDVYRGSLRGARGTLAARSGNAADRAALLKALLDAMVLPTRFAFADLDDATAERLVARSFSGPTKPLAGAPLDAGETATIDATVQRAQRDYARLRGALGDRVEAMDGSDDAAALIDVRSHVWVQMLWGSRWLDLDPTLPDSRPGDTLTVSDSVAATLPDTERQTVSITVSAETLSDGRLVEQTVLEHQFDAVTAGGQDIYLTFLPEVSSLGGGISEALGAAVSWRPVLYVGSDEPDRGIPFPVRPTKDLFDGTESGPVVSALRLDVSVDSPGQEPLHATRTLLDRVPRSVRGAAEVDPTSLAPLAERNGVFTDLSTMHHLQISTGGLNERAHAVWRGIAANFVGAVVVDPSRLSDFSMPGALLPLTVADETLALDSERLIHESLDVEHDVRAFVARPRVFISSLGAASVGSGTVSQTDLLIDGVRILTGGGQRPADAARRQLWYASLESALETQLGLERAAGGDPGPHHLESTSIDLGAVLTVIEPVGGGTLPPGAGPELAADLQEGKLVVVRADSPTADAWWAIDPRTGAARAMLRSGLGGMLDPTKYTPNNADRIDVSRYVKNPESYKDIIKAQDKLEEAEAAARSAPKQICFGGNEETATLCVSQMAFYAYAAAGLVIVLIIIIVAIVI